MGGCLCVGTTAGASVDINIFRAFTLFRVFSYGVLNTGPNTITITITISASQCYMHWRCACQVKGIPHQHFQYLNMFRILVSGRQRWHIQKRDVLAQYIVWAKPANIWESHSIFGQQSMFFFHPTKINWHKHRFRVWCCWGANPNLGGNYYYAGTIIATGYGYCRGFVPQAFNCNKRTFVCSWIQHCIILITQVA